MNKLRVGVVGIGYLGNYHAEKYAKMKDVELVGVVDVDKKRAEAAGNKFSTTSYFDHQDLSGKVDAVSIVVPTPDHFTISRFFLENDIDVLIEKPMTTDLNEADCSGGFAGLSKETHVYRIAPAQHLSGTGYGCQCGAGPDDS